MPTPKEIIEEVFAELQNDQEVSQVILEKIKAMYEEDGELSPTELKRAVLELRGRNNG